jgi:hypothetical protein
LRKEENPDPNSSENIDSQQKKRSMHFEDRADIKPIKPIIYYNDGTTEIVECSDGRVKARITEE